MSRTGVIKGCSLDQTHIFHFRVPCNGRKEEGI